MHFLDFVFFVKYSKEETSHYQAFGNQNIDLSFVKQCQVISCNLFLLYIYVQFKCKKTFATKCNINSGYIREHRREIPNKTRLEKNAALYSSKFFYISTREYYYAQIESNKK